jgi:hypothetical protein
LIRKYPVPARALGFVPVPESVAFVAPISVAGSVVALGGAAS